MATSWSPDGWCARLALPQSPSPGRLTDGRGRTGLPRPDVGKAYSRVPQAQHSGFRLKLQIAPSASGEHQIDIRAHNGLDDIEDVGIAIIATAPVSAAPQPSALFRPTDRNSSSRWIIRW